MNALEYIKENKLVLIQDIPSEVKGFWNPKEARKWAEN